MSGVGLGMWLNELHADFLARDRLTEARLSAAARARAASAQVGRERGNVVRDLWHRLHHLGRALWRVTRGVGAL